VAGAERIGGEPADRGDRYPAVMVRILLVGVPRSGTSWTGRALGSTLDTCYVDEPDGFRDAFAFKVMMEFGEYAHVEPGAPAPEYRRLWAGAFAGGSRARGPRARLAEWTYQRAGTPARRSARRGGSISLWLQAALRTAEPAVADPSARNVVVKSVQCALALEWIAHEFAPRVVVLFRHPLNTIASWRDMGFVASATRNPREHAVLTEAAATRWGVVPPPADAPELAHHAFEFGVLTNALADAAAVHPDWIVARHEELCVDAPARLRELAEALGLDWSDAADRFVRASDREGAGFATTRVASAQPDRWRDRLSTEDVDAIREVLRGFPDRSLADC
jgi:hypothetical protein